MDIYHNILNMSYFKFMNNYLRRLECCLVMGDNDRAAMTKQRSLPADRISSVLRILFVDTWIYQRTKRTLSHCRNDSVIYRGNGKWTKLTDSFVIRFRIYSLFSKMTKRRSAAADHMRWVLLILFIDTSIDQGNECILSPCRNNPVIYRTNCPMEKINWLFCEKI